RLHYVYPYPHVDEVLGLMADGKILPYLDIPFQHASPRVLRAMKRPGDHETMLERIRTWRRDVPDLAIRSTFIVGFPGETEEDFRQLTDFLAEAKIDRVGAFEYEPVAGAPANDLGLEPVAPEVKKARWKRLMETQQKVSAKISREKIGKRVKAIVDEVGPSVAKGRTMADAPEIDGAIHIASSRRLRPGDIVDVRVEAADAYDLKGRAA
ncbi:MAG: radical SAM protein, partial [Rhodoblastus sp.]|nr:radical SAM protein [Rhodoblastus sp.]